MLSKDRYDRMVVGCIYIPVQSVPSNNKVVSLIPSHGEVNSIQLNVVNFVFDWRKRSKISVSTTICFPQ